MELELNGVTYFPDHCLGTVTPTRWDMWKWRLWRRFFGHERPAPYENAYLITCSVTGRKLGMVSYSTFEKLKAEVDQRKPRDAARI